MKRYDANKFVQQTGLNREIAIAIKDGGAFMKKRVTEVGPSLTDFVVSIAKGIDTSNASFNLTEDLRMQGIAEIQTISAQPNVYGARVHLIGSNGYSVLVNVPDVNGSMERVKDALKDFQKSYNKKD